MKKLLLLLMAVLLFAPPRANAATEKTLNFFVTKNSTPWTVTNDTYSANGVGFMYVDIFSSNTATAVTTGSNSAIHNNNISSTVYIKNIEIKNHATCSHNHTQAAWKNFPTNNFPITVTAIKRNDGNSTSGKLVYTAGSSSKANQITLNRETGLNFAIQYGKITKVEIEFKSAVANALVACEGTVRQLPSDDTATATSYVFVPADNSKIVSIANTAATATQPIGLIKISYEEGTPPVPANPTVEDLKLVCDVKYGYAIEGNSIYVTGEPVSGNYGLWTKAIKDIIAGTAIEDATGLAYTFKDLTKPTDITGIKAVGTGNPINEWVKITNQVDSVGISFKELINKTNEQIGTNQSYYLGLIKFVAFNKDLASDPLVLNVYIKRLPAPEIDLEKTCAVNGQSFNTSTNELTYEKGNPTIYFKSMANYLNWGNIQAEYSIDDDTNWTTCKLENKTDEPKITISNWNNNPPYVKNGTANDIKLRVKFTSNNASGRYDYYDENYGKTQPYVLIKTRSISNNVSSLTAPTISVTGKTVDLEGGVKGYLTLPTVSATMAKVEGEVNGTLQFQVSTTTPPAQVPDDNGWTNYTIQAFNQQVSDGFTGRIFFHEYKSGFNSSYSHVDLSKVSGTALTDISYGTLTDAAVGTPVSEGTAVTINGPLYVRGVYESNSPTASGKTGYVLFVTDKDGNAMRVNGEYTKGHAFNGIDFSGKNPVLASVTGVLTGQNKGFPELTLTTPAIDYTALLTAPIEGGDAAPEAETTFSLEKKDFSKLMLFTNFTYKGDDTFADRDGNLVKIYHRLGSSSDWDEITNYLDENVTYRVLGYVGYAPEGLVIMPLDAVPGLRLLAPNPINPEAAPGEFIEMNVISEKLTLTANLDGVDDEGSKVAKIQYVFTSQDLNKDNFQSWVDGIDWTQSPAISQSATDPIEVSKDQLSQGGCILAARLVGNSGLASGIVTVRFNKIDVPADNHLGT
ncbi:MAG: hypothetical protein K2G09_01025, partial [Paramuribaculum sp.]|nr:hypothetical protein [Paramuribaculum sp.]